MRHKDFFDTPSEDYPPKPRLIRMAKHQSWGNNVYLSKPMKQRRRGLLRRRQYWGRVTGWLARPPRVGDLFLMPTQEGPDAYLEVMEVEQMRDPRDMFFADVKFVGWRFVKAGKGFDKDLIEGIG